MITSKFKQLRSMLLERSTYSLMESHHALSARIAERAGFKALWASGFSISASLGLRDNNELSWSQMVDQVEFINDAVEVPILFDGDSGFGNFNNVRRLVKKLEQRGIAGVCIEDKTFPKQNSFTNHSESSLIGMDEFCGKIKAAKDTQLDSNFVLVARVESFIVGAGLNEALKRAEAYRKAGADAIFIHSKQSTPHEIESFVDEWSDRLPLVIAPTTYIRTSKKFFKDKGVQWVIYANQNMRASILAMEKVCAQILEADHLDEVDAGIAPISKVFDYQNLEELHLAEKKYLP